MEAPAFSHSEYRIGFASDKHTFCFALLENNFYRPLQIIPFLSFERLILAALATLCFRLPPSLGNWRLQATAPIWSLRLGLLCGFRFCSLA